MISNFLLSFLVSAQAWNRRAYFNDVSCKGDLTVAINIYMPYSPCGNAAKHCEVKAQDVYKVGSLRSGETSGILLASNPKIGCDVGSGISDATYMPAPEDGKLKPQSNYITVNAYTDATCTVASLTEQNTFLADGNCYAVGKQTGK